MKSTAAVTDSPFGLNRIKHWFKNDEIIGFDLGREKLNLVQLGFHAGLPFIHTAVSDYHNADLNELLENPESMIKLIKAILKNNKFKSRKVVSSLPAHFLKILFVSYQLGKNETDTESLLSALKRRVNTELSDYVIDYLPIKPDAIERNDRMALVAMAKTEVVEGYLELLTGCGLEVIALEIGPIAILRLINQMAATDQQQKVLTVNFSAKRSYLTVIWNNELLFDRQIDFGLETILDVVARAFDIQANTALEVLHKYGLTEEKAPVCADRNGDIDFDDADDNSIKNALYDILGNSQ